MKQGEYQGTLTTARGVWQSLMRIWLLVAVLTCWVSQPAAAALQEIRVLAQGSGASREEAKNNALTYAKQAAVVRVARKLDPEKAPAFLRTLDIRKVEPYIRGIEVLSEQRVEGVYYAQTRVTVMDGPIRKAYGMEETEQAQKQSGASTASRAITVLPVFYNGVEPILWDPKGNPTFELWKDASLTTAHGALIVPAGDTSERAIVDRDNVLRVPYAQLKALLERYGSDEMVIAVLQDTMAQDHKLSVEMLLRRVRSGGEKIERFEVRPKDSNAPREELYAQAVTMAAERLTNAALATAYQDKKEQKAAIKQAFSARFVTLQQWANLEKILRETKGVQDVSTQRIQLHEAQGVLFIDGEPAKVRSALEKRLVRISEGATGWAMIAPQK